MLSELIIAGTLVINAFAVLNFNLSKSPENAFGVVETNQTDSLGDKIRNFLRSLQYFRVFVAIWNIFIIFLMLVFFSH
ncbi:hypothetical protein GCK72_008075 [Caenorhabditis remanei]|nr:hypothetical protein GCK72_008075 [Caenorhabditis remanei]KAF1768114.1 hypothetical protein GCK72_008075 [Caenorhabditis remanei]